MRAFVGVRADAATAAAAAGCRQVFPGHLHWLPDANLHLTLAFLGDLPADALPALTAALAPVAAGQSAFALHWQRWDWFPSEAQARVLALLPAPCPTLMAWQARIDAALRVAGFRAEARPYRPHLSLARVRRAEAALPAAPGLPCAMAVSTLSLFRSDRGPQGVRYEPCCTWPLASSGGNAAG